MQEDKQEEKDDLCSVNSVERQKLPPPQKVYNLATEGASDTQYEVTLSTDNEADMAALANKIFKLHVKNLNIGKQWDIIRNYDDFTWLFAALKIAFPGYILPYFCSPQVVDQLNKQMAYLNIRERTIYLSSRLQELKNFINQITKHPDFGFSGELRVFLIENWEDHKKQRRGIDVQIGNLQLTNLNPYGAFSILKGWSWFGKNTVAEATKWSNTWKDLKFKFENYSEQLFGLTQKIFLFKRSKEDETNWKGPDTEIDALQLIKAKIYSGNSFCEILIAELECKILLPLINQCKRQCQIKQQLRQRESIEKIRSELAMTVGNKDKVHSLAKQGQKFQTYFGIYWAAEEQQWLKLATYLDVKFHELVEDYMRNMNKIWK